MTNMTTGQQEQQQQLLREKRDSIVKKLIEAENRHDVNAALAAFHTPRYVVFNITRWIISSSFL